MSSLASQKCLGECENPHTNLTQRHPVLNHCNSRELSADWCQVLASMERDCMTVLEGHRPFVYQGLSVFFRLNHPLSPVLIVNLLTLRARWGYWSTTTRYGSGSYHSHSSYANEKVCPISSRAGNPLGLGKCRCVIVWLFSPLGPLDPLRRCSNRLAAMALCFWYNDFCVGFCCATLGFFIFECIWKCTMCFTLPSDMCK